MVFWISSVFVTSLSMIFKYFTNETFPWFVNAAIGLGIVGISGGLLAILNEPTPLSITHILVTSLVLVWTTNQGDKMASPGTLVNCRRLFRLRTIARDERLERMVGVSRIYWIG